MLFKDIDLSAPRPIDPVDGATEEMSRVVCGLLVQGLKRRLQFEKFWKVSIGINPADNSDDGKIFQGVLIVNRRFPKAEFITWNLPRRQSYMLDFVSSVLKDVCLQQGQDAAVVDEARSFVLEHQFRRTIVGKKRFPGPEPRTSAHIECDQEMDQARIYIVARLSDKQVRRIEVAISRPDEFIIQGYFCDLMWTGPRTIVLNRRDGVKLSADFGAARLN